MGLELVLFADVDGLFVLIKNFNGWVGINGETWKSILEVKSEDVAFCFGQLQFPS